MKKITLKLICAVMTAVILCSFISGISVAAEGSGIQPRLSNVNSYTLDFEITSADSAVLTAIYFANSTTFTQAKITVEIQKQTFWFFWTTVDIGTTDNKWYAYSTDVTGVFSKTFTITGAGTYRAIIKLEFSGTGTATDTVEETIEKTY